MRTFSVVAAMLIGVVSSAVALVASAPQAAPSTTPSWHLTATLAESCSCTVACPCNFGGKPNHDPCQGNRLYTITKGHYGDIDLSGVSFLMTFQMGAWSEYTVNDKASDTQRAALATVLPLALGNGRAVALNAAPMTMDRTDSRVRFSTPTSAVDMEVMKGFDGQAVKILNLPNPAYQDYTQFRSVVHQHTDGEHQFSHTGTNGFTSTWDVGSR